MNCKLQQQGLYYILDALKEIPTLTFLNLSSNIIDTSSAILLSKVAEANIELSHVDLSKCMIREEGLMMITISLSELPSLCYISLSYNVISDQVADHLSHCFTNIKHVLLRNCKMQLGSLNSIFCALQSISSLQQLDISENELADFTTSQLENVLDANKGINWLNLASCVLPMDSFWPVKSSSIEYLDMSGNTFNNVTIEHVSTAILKCDLLNHFKLSDCLFHGTDVKCIFDCLRDNKSISFLDLSEAAMLLASGIVNNHTLKHLFLQHCNIPEKELLEIVNALKSCDCLSCLDFSYNNISSTVARVVKGVISANSNLTYLAIASCGLTEQCTKVISNGLAKATSLIHLDISYNTLENISVEKLAVAVMGTATLKHLDLSYCELTEKGFIRICKFLSSISNLRYLNIAENRINNRVAESLASALSCNCKLNYLNLCNCQLQELGINRILGTLCESNVLHHLNLNWNPISDQIAYEICDLIATSTSLTALEISSCNVSEEGMKVISESLIKDNNTPLQCLDVSCNIIGPLVAANILSANKYLKHLDISECNISERQFI